MSLREKKALGRSAERALGGRVLAGEVVQHAEHAVHLDVVALGRDLLDHLVRWRLGKALAGLLRQI